MQRRLVGGYVYVRVSGYDVSCMHPDAPESMETKWMAGEWSEHAKAFAALTDGQLQHPVHLFIRVIRREAQLVKTGKTRGEVTSSHHQKPWQRLER